MDHCIYIMRSLTLFCLVFILGCSCEVVIRLEPEITARVIESAMNCINKHALSIDVLERLKSKDRSKDEKFLKFLYCTLENLKVVRRDGHYIEEEALKLIPKQHKELLKKAFVECNKETGADRFDVLFKVSRCIEEKSNVRVSVI